MKDINSSLMQAYYEIIDSLNIPVYEGQEPDDIKDKIYCVISDVVNSERSTDNSDDVQTTIQLTIHSWEHKYNNSKQLNQNVDLIGGANQILISSFDISGNKTEKTLTVVYSTEF